MFVTVGICTFNRADSLRRTLDSLVAMRIPNDLSWEIVIVNNNSTDYTDDVIGEYVVVEARWLTAYVEAFQCWPEAAVFGGRIKPGYEAPVERWIIESEAE